MEKIEIQADRYCRNYNFNMSKKDKKLLEQKLIYYYDEKTTLLDLFKFLNKEYSSIILKKEEISSEELDDKKLIRSRYRIRNNGKLIYIYDTNIKLICLLQTFNIKKIEIVFSFFIEIGGKLITLKGMNFYMHSNENGKHHLPHIHVEYKGKEVSIALDGKILDGEIKRKYQKLAQKIIVKDRDSFLLKWNSLTNGQKFHFVNNELVRLDGFYENN